MARSADIYSRGDNFQLIDESERCISVLVGCLTCGAIYAIVRDSEARDAYRCDLGLERVKFEFRTCDVGIC